MGNQVRFFKTKKHVSKKIIVQRATVIGVIIVLGYYTWIPDTLAHSFRKSRLYKKQFLPAGKKHAWTPRSACPYFIHTTQCILFADLTVCREYDIVFCDQGTFVSCVSHATTALVETFTTRTNFKCINKFAYPPQRCGSRASTFQVHYARVVVLYFCTSII